MNQTEYNDKKQTFAVYGTLRLNQGNYERILKNNSKHIKTINIPGFEMFSLGGFPGIKRSNDESSTIVADLFEVSCPETKRRLDMLEGYNKETDSGMYLRRKVELHNEEDCEIYIWNYEDRGPVIENGDWVEFKNQRNQVNV